MKYGILISILTATYPLAPAHANASQEQSKGIIHEHKEHDDYAKIVFVEDVAVDRTDTYARYLKATHQHAKGNLAESLKTFQSLLTKNASPHIYDAFIRLLFDHGNFFAIANLVEERKQEFEKLFNENLDIKLIIAQALLHSGKDDQAEELFLELSEKYPDNEQVAYYTAVSYIKGNDLQQAIEYINEALERPTLRSKNFIFHFLKSKIYMMTNQYAQALESIEESLKLFPKFDRGWLFKAMLLEQQGKVEEAIGGYERFLNLVGRDVNVEKQLIQLLFSQQQFSKAAQYLKKIKSNTPEYFFDLALIESKARNHKQALEYIDKCLAQKKDFDKAKFLKIEILVSLKATDKLLTFVKQWLALDTGNITLLHTLLLLRKTHIEGAEAIATLESLVEENKHSVAMLSVLADLCQETKQYAKGIKHYEKILSLNPSDGIKSRALFHIGHLYFLTKQADKVVPTLEKAISFEPAHPSAYNLLAYHYAQERTNLPKALELIDKALQKKPGCYYYLDTKGLIYLKMGKQEEAQNVLKQALRKAPHDKVIQEHLRQATG